MKTAIRVGVVGYPNVGKSSVINSLKRSKACSTGSVPGVTRCLQEIQLDKKITLLDSPGLVLSRSSDDSLKNVLRVEHIQDPVAPVESILRRCDTNYIRLKYDLPVAYRDTNEFLYLLAITTGKLKKGGIPDLTSAARMVINDWNTGSIRYFTHPPEAAGETTKEEVESRSVILSEFSKEFDLSNLDDKMDFDMLPPEEEDTGGSTLSETQMSGKKENIEQLGKFGVDKAPDCKVKFEDLSMANVGKKSLKKLKRLGEKKARKDRNRRDRVAADLSDKLERAFEAI